MQRAKRPRTSKASRPTFDVIKAKNPDLDEKYGHAVFLCPQGDIDGSLPVDVSLWDQVADWLTTKEESGPDRSGKIQIVRISKTKVRPGALCLLYIVHPTAQILSSAIVAGFFCFGTDFKWPGKALQSRGLLSIELAGEFREPRGQEPGGRVILHRLEDLVVGRKTVRAVTDYPAPDELKATSSRRMYRLRVADDFYKVWEQCVAAHGIDWMGFDTVRDAYAGLNQLGDSEGRPRLICIELVDIATGDVASGEVGVITGQCYTCLSLFADVDRFPRCDRVRQAASILWLARGGVVVFDVGITAEYFVQLSGFHRATREEFLSLWRRHRFVPHDRALIYQPCSTIYSLLAPRCKDRDVPAPVVPEPTPSAAKPVVRVVWSAPCADATEHGVTASFPAGCVDKVKIVAGGKTPFAIVHLVDMAAKQRVETQTFTTCCGVAASITTPPTKEKQKNKTKGKQRPGVPVAQPSVPGS